MGRQAEKRLSRREQRMSERDDYARAERPTKTYDSSFQPPVLVPKNENQRRAREALQDGVPVVLLTGSAGTGKSLLAAERVAQQLRSKEKRKVFLVRPAVTVGKSIGLLPGDIKEKMNPYFAQTLTHISKFMKHGDMAYYLEKEAIQMQPVEYLRGMSFEDCIVVLEEAQNFTAEEFEMLLTRLGDNCQMIFTGDVKQTDLKQASGMQKTIDLLNRMLQTHPNYLDAEDIDALDEGFAVVSFSPDDVVRSGFTRAVVKTFYHNS